MDVARAAVYKAGAALKRHLPSIVANENGIVLAGALVQYNLAPLAGWAGVQHDLRDYGED